MSVFEELYGLNVNGHTEKLRQGKVDLTYLSWTWAWAEVKKRYEDPQYTIWKFQQKDGGMLPYMFDPNTGYMVMTSVTIEGITHDMWLPVMDGANKAMKDKPYSYKVKEYVNGKFTGQYTERWVEPATMFDINKTIMRCLVKNLAMFGLGLYIYAGEDLPEVSEDVQETPKKADAEPVPTGDWKCEVCGSEIVDGAKTDGTPYPRIICRSQSKQKFGKQMCIDCFIKEIQKQKASEVNLNE